VIFEALGLELEGAGVLGDVADLVVGVAVRLAGGDLNADFQVDALGGGQMLDTWLSQRVIGAVATGTGQPAYRRILAWCVPTGPSAEGAHTAQFGVRFRLALTVSPGAGRGGARTASRIWRGR